MDEADHTTPSDSEAEPAPEAEPASEAEPAPEAEPASAAGAEAASDAAAAEIPAGETSDAALPGSAATGSLDDDGGGDEAFSADLGPEVRDFGQSRPGPIICQWCGAELSDPSVDACPVCNGRLKPIQEDLDVPGVTAISAEARAAQERVEIARLREAAKRGEISQAALDAALRPRTDLPPAPAPVLDASEIAAAIQPPDQAVRQLIEEMELRARQAALERDRAPDEVEAGSEDDAGLQIDVGSGAEATNEVEASPEAEAADDPDAAAGAPPPD